MSFRMLFLVAFILSVTGFSAFAGELTVVQSGRKFVPASITIKVGDTVKFKNQDTVSHNIFSASAGQAFDLRIQRPGQTTSHTFTAPGKAEIRCAIHPQMKLVVTIEE